MIKNMVVLLSSCFESKSTYYLPRQVSRQNSLNFVFEPISLFVITGFKNDRDRTLRVGLSYHKEEVTFKFFLLQDMSTDQLYVIALKAEMTMGSLPSFTIDSRIRWNCTMTVRLTQVVNIS